MRQLEQLARALSKFDRFFFYYIGYFFAIHGLYVHGQTRLSWPLYGILTLWGLDKQVVSIY